MVKSVRFRVNPVKGSIHSLPFHSHPFSLICLYSCDYCHLIVQLHPPTTIYVATIMKRTGKEQGVLSSVCSQDYNLAAAFGDYRRSLRRASESSVWREDPGLLSRPCRKRRPLAREDGGVSGVSPACRGTFGPGAQVSYMLQLGPAAVIQGSAIELEKTLGIFD